MPISSTPVGAHSKSELEGILGRLAAANAEFLRAYPGDSADRQPVHTVYGGAQLFRAETTQKLGEAALRTLTAYAPNFVVLARALSLRGAERLPEEGVEIARLEEFIRSNPHLAKTTHRAGWLAHTLYERVIGKLQLEAVEDFRIDFEDGYGIRDDAQEDRHAVMAAQEVARGQQEGLLPPFIGIRIKPFNPELHLRSLHTLDLFLKTLLSELGGRLPANFVVTLPKVTRPEQVTALSGILDLIEDHSNLPRGTVKIEIMVETPQSILGPNGEVALLALVRASAGRCVSAHFGTYDYTAGCQITAAHQNMRHPVCDHARHAMQVALAGTGVMLSDGATNIMPIGPHRRAPGQPELSTEMEMENRQVVHRAWKLHYDDIQHSLRNGFYQGWDLHPGHLPTRYAAVYSFFLEGLEAAATRLKNFVAKAAQATLIGDVFDDAATGQGLLNFFLRGIACGAITEEESRTTDLSVEDLRSRSFGKILEARRTSLPGQLGQ